MHEHCAAVKDTTHSGERKTRAWAQQTGSHKPSRDDLALRVEPRSVTGTIPALLGGIPTDDALEVRAHRRVFMETAARVPVSGDLVHTAPDDATLAARNVSRVARITR